MGHEIFQNFWCATKYFLMFYFRNFDFSVRGLKHKISKLAMKEIEEREDMINKSQWLIHSADIRQFDPIARVFALSNWHKIQICGKFPSVVFICLTPVSQLQFGLIGCMILINEYVSLTTDAMKMSKRHFYSDHSNAC